jgi:hypothetical protein
MRRGSGGVRWASAALVALAGCQDVPPQAPKVASAVETSAGGAAARDALPALLQQASDALLELDLERARAILGELRGATLELSLRERLEVERARLALDAGDCDAAMAIVEGLPPSAPGLPPVADVAKTCRLAVAGAFVLEDEARGMWLRLQDPADMPLVPFIKDVIDQARTAAQRDLGVDLPRPLRVDVVRDLNSLSAISGLPLEAAQTTGTVAVARWGRVTFLSPSAAPGGYPWQDTMAHELIHLALSRATRDSAPLWLQEGVAKRQESRWRLPRSFDDPTEFDRVALTALVNDESVGVNALGPSIAMLPSARAASIAFAEVSSFINYWIAVNGRAAFRLFLAELKTIGSGDADTALVSTSGYDLSAWIARWQLHLLERSEELLPHGGGGTGSDLFTGAQALSVGDVLWSRHRYVAAADWFGRAVKPAAQASPSAVPPTAARARAAKAALALGNIEAAAAAIAPVDTRERGTGEWYALRGRFAGDAVRTVHDDDFSTALGSDPWQELAACRGYLASAPAGVASFDPNANADWRALCQAARARPLIR